MAEHKERLARAMTREMGKVLAEARGDVQEGIDIAFLMAGEGRRMFGDTTPSELPDKWAMSIRQPIGVAGIITPWNFPMAIPCWKMMPALVTGNTVVLKPSSDTPHCATLLVELMAEAGFPPGTVNLVTGPGAEVGDALVESPDVPVISFTGNTETGRRIAELAGRAAQAASASSSAARTGSSSWPTRTSTWRSTASSGRPSGPPASAARPARGSSSRRRSSSRCSSASRPGRAALRLGSGLEPTTDVGPLVNAGAVDKVGSLRRDRPARGRARDRRRAGDRRRARARPLLRADDLRRRQADGPDRPGGDLRAGPLGHPGARLPGRGHRRSTRPATACRRSIFTRDVNTAFRAMRDFETGIVYVNAGHDRRRDPPAVRRHEGRPATATARPATPRSTRTPSGSRSTSTSAAGSSGPRSTTSPTDRPDRLDARDPSAPCSPSSSSPGAAPPPRPDAGGVRADTDGDDGRLDDLRFAGARDGRGVRGAESDDRRDPSSVGLRSADDLGPNGFVAAADRVNAAVDAAYRTYPIFNVHDVAAGRAFFRAASTAEREFVTAVKGDRLSRPGWRAT